MFPYSVCVCAVSSSFYCSTITVWPLSICLCIHTVHTYVPLSLLTYVHIHTHAHAHAHNTTQHTHTHTCVHTVRDNVVDFKTLGNQVAACVLEEVCVCLSVCLRTHIRTYACHACIVFGGCNVYLTYFACPVTNMCSHSSLSLVPPTPFPPPPPLP